MTTSIDPSRDELFLLDDNQYQISNVVLTNIKPIGAERKRAKLLQQNVESNHLQANSFIQFESSTNSCIPQPQQILSSPINRFPPPASSLLLLRQSSSSSTSLNIYQQIRSRQPIFTNPFHSTRERFQVNSIGRPIFRTNHNYNHRQ